MFERTPKVSVFVQGIEQGLRLLNPDAAGHNQAYGNPKKEPPVEALTQVVEYHKRKVPDESKYTSAAKFAEAFGVMFPPYDPSDPAFPTMVALASALVLEQVDHLGDVPEVVRTVIKSNSVFAEFFQNKETALA